MNLLIDKISTAVALFDIFRLSWKVRLLRKIEQFQFGVFLPIVSHQIKKPRWKDLNQYLRINENFQNFCFFSTVFAYQFSDEKIKAHHLFNKKI